MSNSQNNQFYKSDLDPMNLVLKLDIDIIKMYHYIKNEISVCQGIQKLYPEQVDRHTDRHSDILSHRHTDSMKTLLSRIRWR